MRQHLELQKHIVAGCVAFACALLLFAWSGQVVFATDSIPAKVVTIENGDLDHVETVWEGSCALPGGEPVGTGAVVSSQFASKIPDGYNYAFAAVYNTNYDRSIYRVAELDGGSSMYRLEDNTTYGFHPGDVLVLYCYEPEIQVPVYWCQYDRNGTLTELTDQEYEELVGGKRVTSIAVGEGEPVSMAPVDEADVVTANTDSPGFSEHAIFMVGPGGLAGGSVADADGTADGGTHTYQIDSEALLMENTPLGLAFVGSSRARIGEFAEKHRGEAGTDAPDPAVSGSESDRPAASGSDAPAPAVSENGSLESGLDLRMPGYSTFSGEAPAVYVIFSGGPGDVPQGSGVCSARGDGNTPWLIAIAAVTLILILFFAARVRRRF